MKITINYLMSDYEFDKLLKHLRKEKLISEEDVSVAITDIETRIENNEKLGKLYTEKFKKGIYTGLHCIYLLNNISYQNYRYEKLLKALKHYLNKLPKIKKDTGVGV